MQSNLKTMASGAGIVFAGMFISKVLTYVWRMVVARVGTEEYGLLSLGLAVLGIATTLSLLGLSSGVLRYVSYYSGKKDEARMKGVITTALKISVPLSILLAAATYLFAEYIAIHIFHNAGLVPVIKIIAFAIPLNVAASIFLPVIRALQKIKYEVITKQLIENVVKLAATVLAIHFGLGLFGITFAYVVAIASVFVFSLYFLEKKVFPVFRTPIKSIFIYRELMSYSLPLAISGMIGLILTWTDTLMLGNMKSASIVGIYNAALPTANLMLLFPTAILSLFLPVITRDYAQGRIENIKNTHITATKWVFIANFPALLLMVFFSRNILTVLFGPEYGAGAVALSILAIGYFILSLAQTSTQTLSMYKKTKLLLKITITAATGNIILNALLIPAYGMVGGAIATSSAFVTIALLSTYHAKKRTKILPYNLDMAKIFLIGIALMAALYFALHTLYATIPIIPAILGTGILLAAYLAALFRLRAITGEEKELMRTIIRKIKNKPLQDNNL
ncbi:MAG: flippase [Candidatus Aenigmarchaeota archaeon]|nr:flippase [Candidatus Aenigmarchaeota archaeon]